MKNVTLLCASALLTVGCGPHVHQLIRDEASPFLAGRLIHEAGVYRLLLDTDKRHYEGEFTVERVQDREGLRKRYGFGSRQWNAIFSGLDKSHVINMASVVPRASNGETLQCELVWRYATRPAGVCRSGAGNPTDVRFD